MISILDLIISIPPTTYKSLFGVDVPTCQVIRRAIAGARIKKSREMRKNQPEKGGPILAGGVPIILQQPAAKEEKKEIKKIQGVSLTEKPGRVPIRQDDEQDLSNVNIKYSLIPRNSKNPYAWVNIKWSIADSSLIYNVFC